MRGQRGYSLVELLVAMAVLLAILASLGWSVHEALLRAPWLEEASDLQQRHRVVVEAIAGDLRAAGAGDGSRSLARLIPAVLPREPSQSATSASSMVLTIRYASDDAAEATLGAPLLPADGSITLQPGGTCVVNALACGFTSGVTAIVSDDVGLADLVSVTSAASGVVAIQDSLGPRSNSYAIGSSVVEVTQVSYLFDGATRVLKRQSGATAVPLVDNLTQLTFSYLASAQRPHEPRPPVGEATCLYDADGTYRFPGMAASHELVPLSIAELVDGPFCGSGPLLFDVDLLRIRAVRVQLRLESGSDLLRGSDPRYFARPGRARSGRVLPDVISTFTVSLRNIGR